MSSLFLDILRKRRFKIYGLPLSTIKMKRIKVLELGWEFPPLINGGLGIACYGLSKALAKYVDLTVIVPRAGMPDNYAQEKFNIKGLNHLTVDKISKTVEISTEGVSRESVSDETIKMEERHEYETFANVKSIPIDLDPYSIEASANGVSFLKHEKQKARKQKAQSSKLYRQKIHRRKVQKQIIKKQREVVTVTQHALDLFSERSAVYGNNLGEKVSEYTKIVVELARNIDFDIIHCHDWMTYPAGIEIKRISGKPLVLHLHASQFDRAGKDDRGWIFDIEKSGMEQADAVIPVSKYTGTIVKSHYFIDPAKVFPIHNGADPVKIYSLPKKFPEKLVLFLGRLTAQKGPEFFLQIAARVLEKDQNVRFVMAGTGEKLRQLIESGAYHGMGGKFHFTGFLNKEKVNDLLAMTDVYCMPSVSEPFGLSALEAAQFGIPAVISKQSGVAEVLKGALKADFWDTHMMADHIVRLLTDEKLYQRVVEQSKADILSSTWDAAANRVIKVYEKLLAR